MQTRVNKWLLMSTSTLVPMLYLGLAFSSGSLLISLLDTFNRDRASTATILSLHVGFTIGFGVISGTLVTKFGIHRVATVSSILVPLGFLLSYFATDVEYLYISFGIITGIGNSLGHITSIVAIGRVFTGSHMMFCLAIHSSSIAISGLIYPYFIDLLISNFGLKGTFLILAALQSNPCSFTILCYLSKDTKLKTSLHTTLEQNEKYCSVSHSFQNDDNADEPILEDKTFIDNGLGARHLNMLDNKKAFRYKLFKYLVNMVTRGKVLLGHTTYTIILITSAFTIGSLNSYQSLLLDVCVWKGFSYTTGLFSFVIYNISTAIIRLIPGLLKHKTGISLFIFPLISSISGCLAGLVLTYGTSYSMYVVSTVLVGIAVGALVSTMTMIAVKLITPSLAPVATGLQFTSIGIITTLIGPIFGKLRDATGSYRLVLLTMASINGFGIVIYSVALFLRRKENRRKPNGEPPTIFIKNKNKDIYFRKTSNV